MKKVGNLGQSFFRRTWLNNSYVISKQNNITRLTHVAGNSCSWLSEGAVTRIAVMWATSQTVFRASTPDIAEK